MGIDTGFMQGGANLMSGAATWMSKIIKAIFSAENIYFFLLCGAIIYFTFWWIIKTYKDKNKAMDSYARRRKDI